MSIISARGAWTPCDPTEHTVASDSAPSEPQVSRTTGDQEIGEDRARSSEDTDGIPTGTDPRDEEGGRTTGAGGAMVKLIPAAIKG